MSNKTIEFIREISELPEEIMPQGEFIILPMDKNIHKLFTKSRLEIISFLKKQNPITETELSRFIGKDIKKDLEILNYLDLIKINIKDKNKFIRLNKEINILPLIK